MELQLQNQVAVVLGAASGIGLAIAKAFAQEGATAVLVDRDERVQAAAATFSPVRAKAHVADVTDYERMQQLAAEIATEVGPVRHVVFAAGAGSGKFGFPFWNLTPADWPRVVSINLLGAVHAAHAFAPQLVEQKQGTLLFVSSVAGQIGSQTDPPYSAAKAALINFAQVAAKDLAPHNVRVNVISPGMIQTPLNRAVWQAWNERQPPDKQRSYEEWGGDKVRAIAPLGRWQTPEDIAALAVFVASDRAANITGQTLNVDGGQVMHS
jgi:NAD(P)-dependent dehydrogenase (short-subunit alcohol dehydrogenase family)